MNSTVFSGTRILTRNMSFSRSLRVSTCLGVNCASGDTKLTYPATARPGA